MAPKTPRNNSSSHKNRLVRTNTHSGHVKSDHPRGPRPRPPHPPKR